MNVRKSSKIRTQTVSPNKLEQQVPEQDHWETMTRESQFPRETNKDEFIWQKILQSTGLLLLATSA